MRAHKQLSFELQAARPGDVLLDLGCGAGDDAGALAQVVGTGGHVIGLDNSETMIAEARRRTRDSSLPVDYRLGDAHHLPFGDDTFDGARAERVFQHLRDPMQAMRELLRVTRPTGRIVIADPCWETLVIDCSDQNLLGRIKSSFHDELANGSAAQQTPGLVQELGLTEITVTPATVIARELGAAELMFELTRTAQRVCHSGRATEGECRRWFDDLEQRDAANRFFAALTGFITSFQNNPPLTAPADAAQTGSPNQAHTHKGGLFAHSCVRQ
jgi:SAM-dependent methyltransferase